MKIDWLQRLGGLMRCLVVLCCCVGAHAAEEPLATIVSQISSDQPDDRNAALSALANNYDSVRGLVLESLRKESAVDPRDCSFRSKLHCSILAVDCWRLREAEPQLLDLADYEISVWSIPVGTNIVGEDMFPAAVALVRLRVDAHAVLMAILRSERPRQVRALAWVLSSRCNSAEEAKLLVERAAKHNINPEQKERLALVAGIIDSQPKTIRDAMEWKDDGG